MNKHYKNFISTSEFSKTLKDNSMFFERNANIGICVSGGPDSTALMMLMNEWAIKNKCFLTILHFNHNLRENSSEESDFIQKISKKLNLECKVFEWTSQKPKASIMQEARTIRYKTIKSYCKKKKIIHLMTAHHYDDFVETFYMRARRGNSTIGLNSIPKKFVDKNLVIYRPLLDFKKMRLIKTCNFFKTKWIDDPSNNDHRYERVRVRRELRKLSGTKKIRNQISTKIKYNENLEKEICVFFLKNLKIFEYGMIEVIANKFNVMKNELKLEILKRILVTCSGKIFPPSSKSVFILIQKILEKSVFKHTLHSCIIEKKHNQIIFYREFKLMKENCLNKIIAPGENILWDTRFRIFTKTRLNCEMIDNKIWLDLKNEYKTLKDQLKMKYEVLKTIPLLIIKNKKIIPFMKSKQELSKYGVDLFFEPRIPLSKNNF